MYNPGEELSSLAFDKIIGGALDAVVNAQNNSSMTTVNFIKTVGFVNDEKGNPVKPVYVEFKYPKEIKPFFAGSGAAVYLQIDSPGSGYSKEALEETYELLDGASPIKIGFELNSDGGIVAANIFGDFDLKEPSKVKTGELTLRAKPNAELGKGAKITVVLVGAKKSEAAIYQDMTLQVPILTMLPIPFIRVASTDIELNVKINSINSSSSSEQMNVGADTAIKAAYNSRRFSASCSINASISNQKKSSGSEEIKKEFSLNIKVHAVQDEIPVGLSKILDILEASIVPQVNQPQESKQKEIETKK